jgi:hypothetical protein
VTRRLLFLEIIESVCRLRNPNKVVAISPMLNQRLTLHLGIKTTWVIFLLGIFYSDFYHLGAAKGKTFFLKNEGIKPEQ